MQPIIRAEEDEEALLIQQELGEALRLSFEGVTREPLPDRMVLLLLRLALAQSFTDADLAWASRRKVMMGGR